MMSMAPQRVLAAVVFTDVVGFTKRTGENEEEALRLLNADFATMREVAGASDGKVKKSTGDGLLMVFQSAIQAVTCAVEIQRRLGEMAKSNPRALKHRIGIHLGDVLLSEDDVVGDGVNVANRLQAEAQPGAICMSQTVYDMVKSKLPIQARALGERQLRNVQMTVSVFEIPPLFGPRGQKTPNIHRASTPAAKKSHGGLIAAIVFAGLCVLGGAIIVRDMTVKSESALQIPPSRKPSKHNDQNPVGESPSKPDNKTTEKSTPANEADKPIESAADLAVVLPSDPQIRQSYDDARAQHGSSYDFDGMLAWLGAQAWTKDANGKRLHGHWVRLKQLREELLAALGKTSQTQPIKVGEDTYYLISGTAIAFTPKDGAVTQLDFTGLKPDTFLALGQSAGISISLLNGFAAEYALNPIPPG